MLASRACGAARQGVSRQAPRAVVVRASDDDKSEEVKYNTEFGYSRKDVLLIGFGLIGGGVLFKWGLEVAGVDPIMAGTVAVVSPRLFVCPVDRVLSSRIWPSSLRRPYIKSPGRDWRMHARTNAPTHARTHSPTHALVSSSRLIGNYAQLIIFVGLCFGWIGSYLFRVATKQMTCVMEDDDFDVRDRLWLLRSVQQRPDAPARFVLDSGMRRSWRITRTQSWPSVLRRCPRRKSRSSWRPSRRRSKGVEFEICNTRTTATALAPS